MAAGRQAHKFRIWDDRCQLAAVGERHQGIVLAVHNQHLHGETCGFFSCQIQNYASSRAPGRFCLDFHGIVCLQLLLNPWKNRQTAAHLDVVAGHNIDQLLHLRHGLIALVRCCQARAKGLA